MGFLVFVEGNYDIEVYFGGFWDLVEWDGFILGMGFFEVIWVENDWLCFWWKDLIGVWMVWESLDWLGYFVVGKDWF